MAQVVALLGVYDDTAVASGIEIEKSKVTIEKAATSINLLTGEVKGEQTVEYGLGIIPAQFTASETLNVDLNKDGTKENYVYLSMSYILANDATTGYAKATLEDLDFTFAPKSGNNINFSEGLNAVPVQRNWRTNIIGKILTDDVTFNITIDPIYDGEYNNGTAQPVNINGVYYATIQDAVNNVQDGEVIKIATGTYAEVVKVTGGKNFTLEAAGPNVVIAALDHQSNANPSTVKVKGITFDNSVTPAGWFIGTSQNIAPCVGAWGGNLSFEDCAFIVAGTSGKETGVMTWWTGDNLMNLSFNNCTFEGKENHSSARAMQIYGDVNMTVENCTFTTAKDYTLKYVAQDGNAATFSNNIVNNSENFVELGSSVYPGANYTANINNNTLGKDVNTHIIANDENQTVNLNGNVSVIAEGLVKDASDNYIASTNNGIKTALQKGVTTINLVDGTYNATQLTEIAGKTLTFIGSGENTVFDYSTQGYNQYVNGNGGTFAFKNMTITRSTATFAGMAHTASTSYENCTINGTYYVYETNAKFTNCKFNVTGDAYNCWLYGTSSATYEKCEFNCSGKSIYVDGNGETGSDLTTNTCVFNDNGGVENKAAIETGNTYGKRYSLTINNTTVNGFSTTEAKSPAVDGAELGTNVWGNKNYMTKDKLSVTIDGTKVY